MLLRYRYSLWGALGICICALVGCDLREEPPRACPDSAEPAIVVEVIDWRTGKYIAADAEGVIVDGSYRDSLRHYEFTQTVPTEIVRSLEAGRERAGTYDVHVEHEGYRTWTREEVHVEEGDCGPKTQRFEAEMREED